MSVFDEPKIDSHCHILDPLRFPYAPDVAYRPAGQETGPVEQYEQVMDAYGIRHALFVGPNSGYGLDNRCLLDALARGAVLARHRAPDPGPVIELLFGRTALSRAFGGGAIKQIGGEPGDPVGVVGHERLL